MSYSETRQRDYYIVSAYDGGFVWAGMAKHNVDALDSAARSRGFVSYRYAIAGGYLPNDAWNVKVFYNRRICHIIGMKDGVERELISGPVLYKGDEITILNEIPEEIFATVDRDTIFCRYEQ